jgi:hypothetical protein
VAGGGVQPQPAVAVDIGHPKGPLTIEDIGMAVENGHQDFVEGHYSSVFLVQRWHARSV